MAEPIRVPPVGEDPEPLLKRDAPLQPAPVLKFEDRTEIEDSSNTRSAYLAVSDAVCSGFGSSYRKVRDGVASASSGVSNRLRYLASEQPLHLVVGVAVASFAAGIGLRIWRSRYE